MAVTHPVRAAGAAPSTTTGTPVDSVSAVPQDRFLWLQVAVAAGIGALAGVAGTIAIVATQTLQMHF